MRFSDLAAMIEVVHVIYAKKMKQHRKATI